MDVYFKGCSYHGRWNKDAAAALTDARYHPLGQRGFSRAELVVQGLLLACQRRPEPLDRAWLTAAVLNHPPTDGSYRPRPLPSEFDGVAKDAHAGKQSWTHRNDVHAKCFNKP